MMRNLIFGENFNDDERKISPLANGMVNILSPALLWIENCDFEGAFTYKSSLNLAFRSFIYFVSLNVSKRIKITLKNISVTDALYPQGFIFTDSKSNAVFSPDRAIWFEYFWDVQYKFSSMDK